MDVGGLQEEFCVRPRPDVCTFVVPASLSAIHARAVPSSSRCTGARFQTRTFADVPDDPEADAVFFGHSVECASHVHHF